MLRPKHDLSRRRRTAVMLGRHRSPWVGVSMWTSVPDLMALSVLVGITGRAAAVVAAGPTAARDKTRRNCAARSRFKSCSGALGEVQAFCIRPGFTSAGPWGATLQRHRTPRRIGPLAVQACGRTATPNRKSFVRWRNDLHDERRRLLGGPEGARNLVAHRGERLHIGGDGVGVALRQLGKGLPWHDGGELAPVGPHALLQRGHDLLLGPAAEAGLLVGRQIGPVEDAEVRYLESHLLARQRTGHVRLAEEVAGRVAVDTAAELHEVLAARNLDARALRLGRLCCRNGDGNGRQRGEPCCNSTVGIAMYEFSPGKSRASTSRPPKRNGRTRIVRPPGQLGNRRLGGGAT